VERIFRRGTRRFVTFSITVLGSSGMFATLERACAGYLVEVDGKKIVLDCGAGTWRNLLNHVDETSIDGVVLTHRHPDHVSDLFQIFHARRYGHEAPLENIPLWAPAETLDRLTSFATELDQAFDVRPVAAGDTVQLDGADFRFFSMAHPPDTVGVRIEADGAVLAYSSDTGPTGDLEGLATAADLFLCEATLQGSDEWEGHMTASQAGEAAARAGVKKVVLTHLPPSKDPGLSLSQAHRTRGDAEVQLAVDGLRLEVGE
jgi:ribonuclease BN (tRNA processing enzyme)